MLVPRITAYDAARSLLHSGAGGRYRSIAGTRLRQLSLHGFPGLFSDTSKKIRILLLRYDTIRYEMLF